MIQTAFIKHNLDFFLAACIKNSYIEFVILGRICDYLDTFELSRVVKIEQQRTEMHI